MTNKSPSIYFANISMRTQVGLVPVLIGLVPLVTAAVGTPLNGARLAWVL